MAQSNLRHIPITAIRENPAALRGVDRENPEYKELVESVRNHGVLQTILVREFVDPNTKESFYSLVDGLHRYNAALDAGLKEIDVNVQDLEDAEALETQIILNATRVETKPVQYTKALERLLGMNPLMTVPQLAAKLNKSTAWLNDRMNLTKLTEDIGKMVDEGGLNITNAYQLAKLPPEEQVNYLDRAISMSPSEFVGLAQARVKEIKDARRAGRTSTSGEWRPHPFLQKTGDIKAELEAPAVGPYLVKETGATTAEQGFALAIQWCLHMDPKSVEQQFAKEEQRKKDAEEAKKRRKEEQDAKQRQDAAEKAEAARAMLERLKTNPPAPAASNAQTAGAPATAGS